MRKKTIQYTSLLDALVAVYKRLSLYEYRHQIELLLIIKIIYLGKYSPHFI